MRHSLGPLLAMALAAAPARALVWPDVADRVERDLLAPDPGTRRAAARQLAALGPGRGAPLSLQALGDPDDDVKLAAAEAAIRLGADGATDAASAWLNAADPRLRRKACEVARALPSPRAVAPLARTLGDPDAEVRAAAAEALGHQASREAVAPLLGRLDDPAPAARVQIVAALARLGDRRAVVPLVGKVQDSSIEVRQAVVRALGDLGDPRASPALVLALRDQSTDVKRDALAALGRMKAAEAVDAIAPLASDRTPALRLAALAALGRIASGDALRVLLQTLGTGDDAAGGLGSTPARDALVDAGDAAVGPLRALLSAGGSSAATATSAAWVLGELRATREAPAIVQAMRRGTLPAAAGLHALCGAGTSDEVPVVLEFVADPAPAVRDEALAAAFALLDPRRPDGRAVEPLAAALRDTRPAPAQRARIATLLGRTGAPRAAPLLAELARAHDPALRLAAIDALGVLGPSLGDAGDQPLLEALSSGDATVRVRAAIALGEAGGATARAKLLADLDGGDEVDRAALLTALGGVMARAATEEAVSRLARELELSAGPERDAVLEALGRARLPAAVRALSAAAHGPEPLDRRAVATALASHAGDAAAVALARQLASDPAAAVRAQAAWTLGALGDPSDEARLAALARDADDDGATNATAALARIAARARAPELSARALCPLLGDPRPTVRANAQSGVALGAARCADGAAARRALSGDPVEDVRAAAALAVARGGTPDDLLALERCARSDPSGMVAARCRARPTTIGGTHAVLVYVVADGARVPHPGAAYALLMADGLIRAGTTDRRGGLFDPVAPDGDVTLRRPTSARP